jgi:hypothetical protein
MSRIQKNPRRGPIRAIIMLAQLAQSGVELGSHFVAVGESKQGLGCLWGSGLGV